MNPTGASAALLQLASPALPIGGYSYSSGLEWAVDSGAVRDEAGAREWIGDALSLSLSRFEGPLMRDAMRAAAALPDPAALDALAALNAEAVAARETAELRLESEQMGYSLGRWIEAACPDAPVDAAIAARLARAGPDASSASGASNGSIGPQASIAPERARGATPMALPVAWAVAATRLGLSEHDALLALFWAFAENQTMVLMKSVPMGQIAAQRLLRALAPDLDAAVARALALPREDWSSSAPGTSVASCRHETQYSRLFRS